MERSRRRRRLLGGAFAGGLAGIVTGAVIATAAPRAQEQGEPDLAVRSIIDAAHVPPLLTLPGEAVTLRYAIVCPAPGDTPFDGSACDAGGDVYLRAGSTGDFTRLPLRRTDDSVDGRYVVDVPAAIAGSREGFSYYAVLRNNTTGAWMTLPAGGADAPQRSLPLARAVTVRLGAHRFGATRAADARVVDAPWGSAVGQVGLEGPPGGLRLGPSSFDVAADGTVVVLDGANRRIERWSGTRVSAVEADVDGAVDDFALAPDGSAYVVDGRGRPPLLRHLGRDGRLIAAEALPERTWSQLRMGPDGPVVHQEPSEQWLRAAPALDRVDKVRSGRAGRPLADGSELVVLRTGVGGLRLARVVDGRVRSAWRIVSETPLGEVQLAQDLGNRVVAVVKTFDDDADEFVVLILDGRGLVGQLSFRSAEWAASAPLARFRLRGSSLYQLGSGPDGAFVDRYDLEVPR
jgi:hypothetical protein